jgi:hypothetical protein
MAIQEVKPKFTESQRVQVITPGIENIREYHLPAHYLNYNGKIGYVVDSGVDSSVEVFLTKLGTRIRLPEQCLKSEETHNSVL